MIEYSQGPTVMMTLGQFQFGISTAAYQEFNRVTEFKWAAQDRFNNSQALQFVGLGDDGITLPGVIYPEYRGGLGQVDTMREMGGKGEPLILIDGLGYVKGRWVITRVEEKGSVFAAAGVARKQEFTLGLRWFGNIDGELTAAEWDAIFKANPAQAASTPGGAGGQLGGLAGLANSAADMATKMAAELNGALDKVNGVAAQIGGAINSVTTPIRRCIDVATGLKNTAGDVKRMLNSSKTALSQARGATQLLNALTSTTMNATQAGAALKKSVGDLGSLASVPGQAVSAVQGAMVTVNRMNVAATSLQSSTSNLLKGLTT